MENRRLEAFRVLGLPADSDRDAVTRAYRRRARSIHPDVSPDPGAAERFAALTAAYRLARAVPEIRPDLVSGDARRPRTTAPVRAVDYEQDRPDGSGRWLWASPATFAQGRARPRPPIVAGPVMIRPHREVGDG